MPPIASIHNRAEINVPDPEKREERAAWNRYAAEHLAAREPELCECAKIGKRALSWAPWIPGLSSNSDSFIDRKNLEFSHEHIFFEESGHNIGFGPKGLFGEDRSEYSYRMESDCYDGSKVREAIRSLKDVGAYNFFSNNCQDFIAKIRKLYEQMR